LANVALSGNNRKQTYYNSMTDFMILKKFSVEIHPPRAPLIKEVMWLTPTPNWIKCNIDGASTPSSSSFGGIFRNHQAELISCFAERIEPCSGFFFFAELFGALKAIEIASHRNWSNLWLETDSSLTVLAFKSSAIIPWALRNKWLNCQILLRNMNFFLLRTSLDKVMSLQTY
jgi:hypothetical protein